MRRAVVAASRFAPVWPAIVAAACAAAPPSGSPSPAPTARAAPSRDALAATPDAAAGAVCGEQTQLELDQTLSPEELQQEAAEGESRMRSSPEACGVADDALQASEDAILAEARPSAGTSSKATPWDRRTPPLYLDRIDRRYRLTKDEKALLSKNGFVVSSRLETHAYGWQLHEIFQSQLPVYVSADALFHAVYVGNDDVLSRVERTVLTPMLDHVVTKLACALPAAAPAYPPDVARDLDVYVAVARALLTPSYGGEDPKVDTWFGQDALAASLVAAAKRASGMGEVQLFGRARMVDWSQYQPRGRYARDDDGGDNMAEYFRASMWLSRLELNLVSRSSRSSQPGMTPNPEETPREALDALALADLVDRAGVSQQVDALDAAWGLLAGRREDVSIAQLRDLRRKASIASIGQPDAFTRLKAAIGDGFHRTARLHWMPQDSPDLPVIATMLGPRVVPDTVATRPLVNDEVPHRTMLHAADMAYTLGDDRAKAYLGEDLKAFPTLDHQLEVARRIVQAPLPEGDLYSAWFGAVRTLATQPVAPQGAVVPSFMTTSAFADARLGSVVAAFGQIRHDYVLLTGQGYDAYGCEIPDGWVEPAVDAYDALARYADRGAAAMATFDPRDRVGAVTYFRRLARLLRVFRAIAASELAGRPLSADERRFLAMVAEYVPRKENCDSCPPPTYTGWWFDLFLARVKDGLAPGAFMADYYTSTNDQAIAYVGATAPRLGVFVVDTGGPPRAFVGPVSHAFEYVGSTDHRLTDADADEASKKGAAPWAASYTAPAPAEPPLRVEEYSDGVALDPDGKLRAAGYRSREPVLLLESTKALGPVTLELLDHHRVPIASETHVVRGGATLYRFGGAAHLHRGGYEGLAVRVGDFQHVWAVPPFVYDYDETNYVLGSMREAPKDDGNQ